MKKSLFVFFSLFSVLAANSQTTITADTIYGVLTAAGSPYLIDHHVYVPVDSSLTIEPGVTIEISGYRTMIACYGTLYSVGTEANPIKLTCIDSNPWWQGLKILGNGNQDTSILRWTTIEKSYDNVSLFGIYHNGIELDGAGIDAIDGIMKLSHCTFTSLRQAVRINRGYARIDSCTFIDNRLYDGERSLGGIGDCDIIIRDCNFINNSGLLFIGYVTNKDVPNISNCTFRNQGSGGSLWLENDVWADSCTFIKDTSRVMTLAEFKGTVSNCTFDSTVNNNAYASNIRVLRSGASGRIRNCIFSNNLANGNLHPIDITSEGDMPVLYNCTFYNGLGIGSSGSGEVILINCIFYKNRWECINAYTATIINCLFLENKHFDKSEHFSAGTGSGQYEWRRKSSVLVAATRFNIYNSIFWGNKNFFNDNINCTQTTAEVNFYNCIVEGGQSSLTAWENDTFTHQDIFQDCITSNPLLDINAARQFRYTTDCSTIPMGYNKGYAHPIAIKSGGLIPDVLSVFQDKDWNTRVMDDTADIGPFETQALWSEIKIDGEPADLSRCAGEDALLNFDIRGHGITSQWQKSTDGLLFTALDAQGISYQIANTQQSDSGIWYRNYTFNTCGDSLYSDTVQLTVNTPQPINLGDDFSLPRDSTAELEVAINLKKYSWSTGDTTSSILLQGNTLIKGDTTISILTTDSNGCVASDAITITIVQGAGIDHIEAHLNVYPNPGAAFITITGVKTDAITFYTLEGKIALETDHQVNINTAELGPGTYIIQLSSDDRIYTTRWIKN